MTRTRRWTAVAIMLLVPAAVFAHAVVSPGVSRPGAYERYVLRVPNESDVPTVRIEIRFPDAVRVISFMDVPGWRIEATMDSTDRAVSVVWTGSLPPARFVELPFIAVNPTSPTKVTWPVTQTYANGQRVEWAGPPGSDQPASVTEIATAAVSAASPRQSPATSKVLSWTAIVLGAVAVMMSLRARRSA